MIDLDLMATKIQEVCKRVSDFKSTYDHEPQSISQLPAATLFWDGFGQEDDTTHSKEVGWRWTVRVYIPMNTSDISTPQKQIRKIVQETIKQFRLDYSLGSTCLYHTIANGEVFALLDQNNPMMAAELTLVAMTEESF